MVQATREYSLLQLQPALLAACCLYLAVRNAPGEHGGGAWDDSHTAACGFAPHVLADVISRHLQFCRHLEVSCRSIVSGSRVKTIKAVLSEWPDA